jgi:hypothetical protein
LYLAYIDESGKASKRDRTPIYVQAAFVILDSEWQLVDNATNTLKAKWFPSLPPSDIELHAYEIVNQKGLYKSLGQTNSLQLLKEIYELITNINCTLLASVIHKGKLYKLKTEDEISLWSHRFLFERICKYIEKENENRINVNESPHHGILLLDSVNPRYDNTIRRKYHGFCHSGTYYQQNEYLIEDPLFVDSQYRNMSQLVDIVAYTVYRRTNITTKPSSKWNDTDKAIENGYQTLIPRFDKDSKGRLLGCGIKHFP